MDEIVSTTSDIENENPNIPRSRSKFKRGEGGGRHPTDFKLNYRALEKRLKRAGIDLESNESIKKQCLRGLSTDLKQKEKDIKRLEKELAAAKAELSQLPFKDMNAIEPYTDKGLRRQSHVRKFVSQIIVSKLELPIREKAAFVKDLIHFQNVGHVETMLNEIMEDDKISAVFQKKIVDKACYRASTSEINRTRDFVERKRMQLSKCKKNQLSSSSKKTTAKIGSKVVLRNNAVHHNSRNDKASRNLLRVTFPLLLPKAVRDDTIQVEHALIDTVAMVKSQLLMFFATEELHQHWVWFYSCKKNDYLYNHVKLSSFYDSTPIGKDGDSCVGLYLRILNAPGLLNKPDFTIILYLAKTREFGGIAIRLLRLYSKHLIRLIKEGIVLPISGYEPTRTLPHCQILLNGNHKIDFDKNLFAADGKAQVGASGAKGVSSYTPEWKHHNPEEMVNPNFPVDIGRYVDFATRSIFYKKIDEFRQEQNKVFTVAMKKIKQDKKLTQEQKTKKVQQDFNGIMIQAVREKPKN